MSGHGGPRYHPPGREGGRPKNEYPTKVAKFQATDDEWYKFIEMMPSDTRKKFEFVLKVVEVAMSTRAQELKRLSKVFRSNEKPLETAAKTIREADKRFFSDEESLQEIAWGVLCQGHPDTHLEAIRAFVDYFVSEIFINTMQGDKSLLAPGSKTLSQLRAAYHAI